MFLNGLVREMKVSGSIYSWKEATIAAGAQKLDTLGVDYFHIDCNDDPTVFEDLAAIKAVSDTPFDLHLITEKPQDYFDLIRTSQIDMCCFQYENLRGPLDIPTDIKCRLGLAITMETPIDVFEPYADRFNFIMFMTTVPGQSGGAFNNEVFLKIREFRARFPSKSIHVDGGVNDQTSFLLKKMGVRLVVVGSFLSNADSVIKSTIAIRGLEEATSAYEVGDFMLFPNEFPVIEKDQLSTESVLEAMNEKRLGVAVMVDEDYRLGGIMTDGDVRRSVLSSLKSNNPICIDSAVNKDPLSVQKNDTVGATLARIRDRERPVTFLPVIDENQRLQGLISFLDLIKGEV